MYSEEGKVSDSPRIQRPVNQLWSIALESVVSTFSLKSLHSSVSAYRKIGKDILAKMEEMKTIENQINDLFQKVNQDSQDYKTQLEECKNKIDELNESVDSFFVSGMSLADQNENFSDGGCSSNMQKESEPVPIESTKSEPVPTEPTKSMVKNDFEELQSKNKKLRADLMNSVMAEQHKAAEALIWFGWKLKYFGLGIKFTTFIHRWTTLQRVKSVILDEKKCLSIDKSISDIKNKIQAYMQCRNWMEVQCAYNELLLQYTALDQEVREIKVQLQNGQVTLNDLWFSTCMSTIDNGAQFIGEIYKAYSVWDKITSSTKAFSLVTTALYGILIGANVKAMNESQKELEKIKKLLLQVEKWEHNLSNINGMLSELNKLMLKCYRENLSTQVASTRFTN